MWIFPHGWLNPGMQKCRLGGPAVNLYLDFPLHRDGEGLGDVSTSNPCVVQESSILPDLRSLT